MRKREETVVGFIGLGLMGGALAMGLGKWVLRNFRL